MDYYYKKEVNLNFIEAVLKVKEELEKEDFGLLTEINVKETLKKKLNVDYSEYIILGACNPSFAYESLKFEKNIGLLLPCNILVYIENRKTYVSFINPLKAMEVTKNSKLKKIAKKVNGKLLKAFSSLEGKNER